MAQQSQETKTDDIPIAWNPNIDKRIIEHKISGLYNWQESTDKIKEEFNIKKVSKETIRLRFATFKCLSNESQSKIATLNKTIKITCVIKKEYEVPSSCYDNFEELIQSFEKKENELEEHNNNNKKTTTLHDGPSCNVLKKKPIIISGGINKYRQGFIQTDRKNHTVIIKNEQSQLDFEANVKNIKYKNVSLDDDGIDVDKVAALQEQFNMDKQQDINTEKAVNNIINLGITLKAMIEIKTKKDNLSKEKISDILEDCDLLNGIYTNAISIYSKLMQIKEADNKVLEWKKNQKSIEDEMNANNQRIEYLQKTQNEMM